MERSVIDAVSGWADGFSQRLGVQRWPWLIRMIIAVVWDIIDISTRMIFWVLFIVFPPSRIIRSFLDFILLGIGVTLWGAVGFLQFIEVFGSGFIADLIPMLTIGGIISRRRERDGEQQVKTAHQTIPPQTIQPPPTLAVEGNFSVEILAVLGSVFVGGGLWLLGVVSGGGAFLIFIFGALLAAVTRALSGVAIPRAIFGVAVAIIGLFFLISLGNLGYFRWRTSPEDYRRVAFEEMRDRGDLAFRTAQKADQLAKSAEGITDAAGRLIEKGKESVVSGLEKKQFRSRGLNRLRDSIFGALKPKEEEKKEETPETAEVKKAADGLGLGYWQKKFYASNHVLEAAEKIRDGKISFWKNSSLISFLLLLAVGVLALAQEHRPNQTERPVFRNDGGSIDDWI